MDPDPSFASGDFVRLAVLPMATDHRRWDEVAFYDRFFERVAAWADPVDRVVELTEREAAHHGPNALDELHVAATVVLGAGELVAIEGPRKPIYRATGVRVVTIRASLPSSGDGCLRVRAAARARTAPRVEGSTSPR